MEPTEYLQLADWRRRTAQIYAQWREESVMNPEAASVHLRAARDDLFHEHPQSPLPLEGRSRSNGLSYWRYDPAYRMRVLLEPAEEAMNGAASAVGVAHGIQLPGSGEEEFSFRRIGRVRLSGPLTGSWLSVFWMETYAGGLFVPFRDATSGAETYGAGRYLLDTVKGADHGGDPDSGDLLLDFNLAYHPSCAYDLRWNCPLAPPENTLPEPVRVGERLG